MNNFIKLIEQNLDSRNNKELSDQLFFIEKILSLIFNKIKEFENLNEAELAFNLLSDIQFVLARAVFKEGVTVSLQLQKFIADFDRIDDGDVRSYLYSQIKSNKLMYQ